MSAVCICLSSFQSIRVLACRLLRLRACVPVSVSVCAFVYQYARARLRACVRLFVLPSLVLCAIACILVYLCDRDRG